MLLVVSGASGVGKTTARVYAAGLLEPHIEPAELFHFSSIPDVPTVAWRQETVERAVRRAVELDREGRHLLLAGDPVPAGEALAAPSADAIDIAVCLLDADPETLNARLDKRQDPPELRHLHLGFAAWMREHAVNPQHVTEAVTNDAWPDMVWDRWLGRDIGDRWAMEVIDTSHRDPSEVGALVADWTHRAVSGAAPVFRRGWHRD